jgi:hypothetical protein
VVNFKCSISGRFFIGCDEAGRMSLFDLLKGEMMSSCVVPEKQEEGVSRFLKIHDMCISMNEK